MNNINEKSIANIRVITQEMISNANSGHPGIALGASGIMHTLFSKQIKISSKDSKWYNRDRFVLAAGHGSSLLYTMLHLRGFDVSIEDLKSFRKLHSKTPGHPEYGYTDGVDCTSGPLGQGIAIATGLALSENFLANKYNKEGLNIFDYYTYVLCGDGDLQEGVTVEALSLAGNLCLNKLIILFDSNDIQLDGKVANANTENIKQKVEAMNFNYLKVNDGDDVEEISRAIACAKESDKPTFIEIKTIIGKTSNAAGDCKVHGAPLSKDEVLKMRKDFGGDEFTFDEDVLAYYEEVNKKAEEKYLESMNLLKKYEKEYPAEWVELNLFYQGKDIINKEDLDMPFMEQYDKATRVVAGEVINKISSLSPVLLGGSADLTKSTNCKGSEGNYTHLTPQGRNICFGVREHAMAAMSLGITLNGMTRAFCSGFFVFSDYCKPSIRLAALMNQPVMYLFTHDSIAVGEDGPTHQPIEQLTMLRSIPNLNVIRPCGREETKEAILLAYNSKTNPTCVVLSRQGIKEVRTNENANENLTSKGAYIVRNEKKHLDAIIFATGSEVSLACDVQELLLEDNIDVRVVSMPSMYLFDKMDEEYKNKVFPKGVLKVGLEMSEAAHMYKYIDSGFVYNITSFGASGKAIDVLKEYHFTKEDVKEKIKEKLNRNA